MDDSVTKDEATARHREGHEAEGTTIHIEVPPEAPWQYVVELLDAVADVAHALQASFPGAWDAGISATRGADVVVGVTPAEVAAYQAHLARVMEGRVKVAKHANNEHLLAAMTGTGWPNGCNTCGAPDEQDHWSWCPKKHY